MIQTTLIDRRNIATELPRAIAAVQSATFVGLDCETHDDDRHPGLNLFMKVNEETRKKAGNKKLVFDHRRTTMTGFSVYPEGCDTAWYVNLGHADFENRVSFDEVRTLLDARPANGFWISHNAPFELVMFGACHNYDLSNVICTMQLSVTAFGDDNYDIAEFKAAGLGGMGQWPMILLRAAQKGMDKVVGPTLQLTPEAKADLKILGLTEMPDDLRGAYIKAIKMAHPDNGGVGAELVNAAYERLQGDVWEEVEDEETSRRRFNREIDEIIGKICAKEADSGHCYNGWVYDLAYGHGLKDLVLKIFGHQMGTFKDTLGDNAHMGQLTGDQVREYGAEDAYWVVPLFRWLLEYVAATSPDALNTFFEQENPMIYVYAQLWRDGMVVNFPSIEEHRELERAEFANLLRTLRAALRGLNFEDAPVEGLVQRQDWYAKNWQKYRNKITSWVQMDDEDDDFLECIRVSSPVGNAWAEERHYPVGKDRLSIMHYMPVRVMIYDLLRSKLMFDVGKLASDGEARGRVKTWLEQNDPNPAKLAVMDCLAAMAGVEQRMKLYLTPYMLLTDPETGRLYPTVNSLLNTRRLGCSTPNAMQLAKRGSSTYVRGFFKGDNPDPAVAEASLRRLGYLKDIAA